VDNRGQNEIWIFDQAEIDEYNAVREVGGQLRRYRGSKPGIADAARSRQSD
jgi:hypothetical protein